MALNKQSYIDYLNAIATVEKPVKVLATYREDEVSIIKNDPNTCFDPFGLPDHLIQKIVRLTDLMQEATDSPVPTPEEILEDELAEETDDLAADLIACAIEKTLDAFPEQAEAKPTALQIVRRRLVTDNPWEIFEEERNRILSLPGAAEALELLFTDVLKMAHHEQTEIEINRMIQWIIVSARNDLEAYREIEKAYQVCVDEARHQVALEKHKAKEAAKKAQMTAAPLDAMMDNDLGFWADGIPADPDEFIAPKQQTALQQAEANLRLLQANRPKHETGTRPVDIYRMYAKALRVVRKAGFLKAGSVLREIQLEGSTPFADMDSPDHINPYTTEIDPEAKEYRLHIRAIDTVLMSEHPEFGIKKLPNGITVAVREDDTPDYERVSKDLKWDPATLETHVSAQEGYSIEPNDEIEEWVNEFWQETKDPVWMQIQYDFSSSDAYFAVSQEARAYTDRIRDFVNNTMRLVKAWLKVYLNPGDGQQRNEQIVDILMKMETWEDEKALKAYLRKLANRTDWDMERKLSSVAIQTVKRVFPKSQEAAEFIAFLNELVQRGENEVDVALIFLSVQNGLMFTEETAKEIKLSVTVGDASTLYDYIEENEEEILANLNDRAPKRWDEPFELVAQVAEQGFQQAIATGDPKSSEIRRTPEYIEGYIRAAMTAKSMSFRDEAGYHNLFEEAGWSNFRMKRSPKGAVLYSEARSRKSTQRQAMAAFWKQYGVEQRRKAESRIKSTWSEGANSGLILSNGRKVTFNIAVMKFNGGEFEHTAEEWLKIAGFLKMKKIGVYFCQLVEKSLANR